MTGKVLDSMASTEELGSALQEELEKAKSTLKGVDESLQRFLGRDPNEPRPIRRRISGPGARPGDEFGGRHVELRGDSGRPHPEARGEFGGRGRPYHGDARGEFGGRQFGEGRGEFGGRPFPDAHGDFGGRGFHDARGRRRDRFDGDAPHRDEDGGPAAKRRITHGSNGRLGVMVIGPRLRRASVSDEEPEPKPSVASHVIPGPRGGDLLEPPDDGRSRQTALQERKGDKENINRSRRMFGALLGTLQRFRRDEVKQKEKVEKRAEIERRLEDAARREKAELRQQRSDMFAQRKRKQQEVRLIEMKMARVKEEESWEAHQKHLMNFIRTSGKPCIYFLPKVAHPNSDALLERSRKELTKTIEERRQRLQDDLAAFDARLQRLQNPAGEHAAGDHSDHEQDDDDEEEDDESAPGGGGVSSSVVVRGGAATPADRPRRRRRRRSSSSPHHMKDSDRPAEQDAAQPGPEREDGECYDEEGEERSRPMDAVSAEQPEPRAVDGEEGGQEAPGSSPGDGPKSPSPSPAAAAEKPASPAAAAEHFGSEGAMEECLVEPPPAATDAADTSPASPEGADGGRLPAPAAAPTPAPETARDKADEVSVKSERVSPHAEKKSEDKDSRRDKDSRKEKDGTEESSRRKERDTAKDSDGPGSKDDTEDESRKKAEDSAEKSSRKDARDASKDDRRRDRKDDTNKDEGSSRRKGKVSSADAGGRGSSSSRRKDKNGKDSEGRRDDSSRPRQESADRKKGSSSAGRARDRRRSEERERRRGGRPGSSRPSRRRSRSSSSSSSSSSSDSSSGSSRHGRRRNGSSSRDSD